MSVMARLSGLQGGRVEFPVVYMHSGEWDEEGGVAIVLRSRSTEVSSVPRDVRKYLEGSRSSVYQHRQWASFRSVSPEYMRPVRSLRGERRIEVRSVDSTLLALRDPCATSTLDERPFIRGSPWLIW